MWVAAILIGFMLLVYVGRQARLGKLKSGPWIKSFRVVRSLIGMALLTLAVTLAVRGAWLEAGAALVASFLFGGSVRFQGGFHRPQGPQTAASYTAEEIKAYQTLDLSIGSDKKAIKAAWKRLMKEAHPDQGGSTSRASALNAARDVLLKRR